MDAKGMPNPRRFHLTDLQSGLSNRHLALARDHPVFGLKRCDFHLDRVGKLNAGGADWTNSIAKFGVLRHDHSIACIFLACPDHSARAFSCSPLPDHPTEVCVTAFSADVFCRSAL